MDINLRPNAKTFFRFAVPSVASMLMYSLYTIMDGVFLSHAVGEYALAAINIVMPYINAVFALAIFLAMGTSTVVAVEYGRGNAEEADRIFTQNVYVLGALSVIIAVLAEIFTDEIAVFLGATESTMDYVVTYLRIVAPFTFFFMMGYGLEVLVKTGGHPIVSIISMCCCFTANIVLHLILVVWLGFGIAGAAVATVTAQGIGFTIFLMHFIKRRSNLHLVRIKKPFLGIYKKILALGLSDFSGEISLALVVFIFNRVALEVLGEGGVVAYAVIAYVNNIVVMLMTGVAQGMQPLVSLSYGAARGKACVKFYTLAMRTVAVIAAASFAVCQAFAAPITSCLLETSSDMFEYTVHALKLFSFSFLAVGFNLCSASFMNATENPARALTVSIGRGIVMITLSVLLMSIIFGDTGLWLATPVSETVMLVINIILTATLFIKDRSFWKKDRLEHAGA